MKAEVASWPYRKSYTWRQTPAALGAAGKLTRIHRPQTNDKVGRFNRTLLDEWPTCGPAPATPDAPTPWQTSCTPATTTAATPHSEARPISRVNNAAGQYTWRVTACGTDSSDSPVPAGLLARVKTMRVPSVWVRSTAMVPPWNSTIFLHMARPMPLPW